MSKQVKQEGTKVRVCWVIGVYKKGENDVYAYVTKNGDLSFNKWGVVEIADEEEEEEEPNFLQTRHRFDSPIEARIVARSLTYYDDHDRLFAVRKLTVRHTMRSTT